LNPAPLLSVKLIHHYGGDETPIQAARVSTLTPSDPERDLKLARYLLAHAHTSPFEHLGASFEIACPLFVRSQIMRHRTFSYNEISRRYTSDDLGYYLPETLHPQHTKALQCSEESTPHPEQERLKRLMKNALDNALSTYHELIESGVSREQARGILPLNLMTLFWMSGNLLNWLRFLKLQLDPHSQKETRLIAQGIHTHLTSLFPQTMSLADELMLGGTTE